MFLFNMLSGLLLGPAFSWGIVAQRQTKNKCNGGQVFNGGADKYYFAIEILKIAI